MSILKSLRSFGFGSFAGMCRENSGAKAFFASILVWGIGVGCWAAVFNNYIVETYGINGTQRGTLEFFREMPGVLLVVLLSVFAKVSDGNVLRVGTAVSLLGALLMVVPVPWAAAIAIITTWSLGEHLVMPVRQSIAMSLAKPGRSGEALGHVTGALNAGTVLGSLVVFGVFWVGHRLLGGGDPSGGTAPGTATSDRPLFNAVWVLIVLLMTASLVVSQTRAAPASRGKRPRFYFRRKYSKFYALELFYGARKQVFFTFGPFVLVKIYGMATADVAMLLAVAALVTALWGGALIGRLTDRWGYRNIMIYDTVILFFVCLLYGFAKDWFPPKIAVAVVCVNYVLDALISNASMATNLYARSLSDTPEELTATLSSGITINHVISIVFAAFGGWVLDQWGTGVLFSMSAVMALANSAFAWTIPTKKSA